MPLYGYGCESCLQMAKILGLQRVDVGTTRSFSPPDFSCLRLGRNRDRGSTVPPVRFPGVKIGMGVEFVSLVWKAGMWAFVNTFRR